MDSEATVRLNFKLNGVCNYGNPVIGNHPTLSSDQILGKQDLLRRHTAGVGWVGGGGGLGAVDLEVLRENKMQAT